MCCEKFNIEELIMCGYKCIICSKEIPTPNFSFGGRRNGKTMMEFQYNMRQLCCSDECWGKWIEEIRRELNEL